MPERFPRIRRKGRRWTHRLWWMRAAAASLDLAALCRRMGDKKGAAEALAGAAWDRQRAARLCPKTPYKVRAVYLPAPPPR